MEEILVVAIVFGSILAAIKLILDHVASRRTPSPERSLTTGELDRMIAEAVEESSKDLRRRIENLEAIATEETRSSPSGLLEEPPQFDDLSEEEGRQTRRLRS